MSLKNLGWQLARKKEGTLPNFRWRANFNKNNGYQMNVYKINII